MSRESSGNVDIYVSPHLQCVTDVRTALRKAAVHRGKSFAMTTPWSVPAPQPGRLKLSLGVDGQ